MRTQQKLGAKREDRAWPNAAKVAVAPVVAWETWPDDLGTPQSHQHTNRPPVPAHAKYKVDTWAVRDHLYAESEGIWRLLELFDRLDLKATFFANGKTVESFPDIAKEIVRLGHDLASENYVHEYSVMMDAAEESESIEKTVAIFREVVGQAPLGYISPGLRATPNTSSLVVEHGYLWEAGYDQYDYPVVSTEYGSPLVQMPYALVDYQTYQYSGRTPRDLAQMLTDEFTFLYEEGSRDRVSMMGYAFHPFLARGYRVRPLEEFFFSIRDRPDVWLATRTEIAKWVLDLRSASDAD